MRRLNEIFLGKPLHWVMWPIIVLVLFLMGRVHLHVTEFKLFVVLLLILSTLAVLFIVFTYHKGERITREPFEQDQIPEALRDIEHGEE